MRKFFNRIILLSWSATLLSSAVAQFIFGYSTHTWPWWVLVLYFIPFVIFWDTLFTRLDNRYNDRSPGRPPYAKKQGHTSGKPSPKWALCRKQVIGRPGYSDYLIRYRLVMTPWFGIMVHKIMRPDSDPAPHDHPWSFISIMLRGGYIEEVTMNSRDRGGYLNLVAAVRRKPGHFHTFRRGMYHKITALPKGHAWTLVLCGPRRDSWGFLVNGQLMDWKDYLADA